MFSGDFQAGSVQRHSSDSAFWLQTRSPAWEISPWAALWQMLLSVRPWLCCQHSWDTKLTRICTVLFEIGLAGLCSCSWFIANLTLPFSWPDSFPFYISPHSSTLPWFWRTKDIGFRVCTLRMQGDTWNPGCMWHIFLKLQFSAHKK